MKKNKTPLVNPMRKIASKKLRNKKNIIVKRQRLKNSKELEVTSVSIKKKPSALARCGKKMGTTNASSRKISPRTGQVPRMAKIDASVKRYEKAARLAIERAEDLSQIAHFLGSSAVEKFRISVVTDWAKRAFLRDVVDLHDAFAEVPLGQLPGRMESFRLLPEALMLWLEEAFDLQPLGEVGKELEIPSERLVNFSYDFDTPLLKNQLIRIRILARGWKRNKTVLIPPRVELVVP